MERTNLTVLVVIGIVTLFLGTIPELISAFATVPLGRTGNPHGKSISLVNQQRL